MNKFDCWDKEFYLNNYFIFRVFIYLFIYLLEDIFKEIQKTSKRNCIEKLKKKKNVHKEKKKKFSKNSN